MEKELKGAPAAAALTEALAERCRILTEKGIEPCLATVRAGENPADQSYERAAVKRCEKIGIRVRQYALPEGADEDALCRTIAEINDDNTIHGCLLFRPLKNKAAEAAAAALLKPEKDVDCMTSSSLAGVFTGSGNGFPPCTAQAVMELLAHYQIPLEGKHVVVIGRSLVIGRPVSMLLQRNNATVTMCHTKTRDLPALCRQADIIVAAAGKARLVDDTYLSGGQIIVDVGIHADANGGICGDVDYEKAAPLTAAITPVPGGVGAVTTAVLCKHVIEAAEKISAQTKA